MANTIQIKRSAYNGTSAPSSLTAGELAFLQGGTPRRFYIGRQTDNGGTVEVFHLPTLEDLTAGDGLAVTAAASSSVRARTLSVNVDDASIEIDSDTLQIKANGIDDTHIDWGTGSGQVSTADIPEATNLYYTDERVDDRVNALFVAGEGIDFTYNDGAGSYTVDAELATTSNPGVASFATADFAVSGAGAVSIGALSNAQLDNSTITMAAEAGSNDAVSLGETFTFTAGEGINTTMGANAVTIAGELATETNAGVATFDGTDFTVSGGDVTVNAERIQDLAGAMVTGNTETNITVTYQDGDGTVDYVVADASDSVKGAASFSTDNFAVSSGAVTIKDGGVANAELANSAITIGGTSTSLGGTITALTALTDIDMTAGNHTILDTVGANTLTIGAGGTTVNIAGNLTVSGTSTTVESTTVVVEDPLLKLSKDSNTDAADIGFYGRYSDDSGTTIKYKGIFSDVDNSDTWTFFRQTETEPTTTVNTSGTNYALAGIKCNSVDAATIDGGSF